MSTPATGHLTHAERLQGESRLKAINLDLVRVTEAAAIAASTWVGSGDKLAAWGPLLWGEDGTRAAAAAIAADADDLWRYL